MTPTERVTFLDAVAARLRDAQSHMASRPSLSEAVDALIGHDVPDLIHLVTLDATTVATAHGHLWRAREWLDKPNGGGLVELARAVTEAAINASLDRDGARHDVGVYKDRAQKLTEQVATLRADAARVVSDAGLVAEENARLLTEVARLKACLDASVQSPRKRQRRRGPSRKKTPAKKGKTR